jgi:hypothetical protein
MRDRRRAALVALLTLLAALVLAVAGCGGDDSSDASGDETTIETTVEDTTAEDTTEETTEGDTTEEMDDADIGNFANEDCLELAGVGAKMAETLGATGASDPEATAAFFDELVSKAPDEIKDDLAVLAGAMDEISEALKDVDLTSGATPDPETLQKLQELSQTLDNAEIQQASQNLEAWATENCSSGG